MKLNCSMLAECAETWKKQNSVKMYLLSLRLSYWKMITRYSIVATCDWGNKNTLRINFFCYCWFLCLRRDTLSLYFLLFFSFSLHPSPDPLLDDYRFILWRCQNFPLLLFFIYADIPYEIFSDFLFCNNGNKPWIVIDFVSYLVDISSCLSHVCHPLVERSRLLNLSRAGLSIHITWMNFRIFFWKLFISFPHVSFMFSSVQYYNEKKNEKVFKKMKRYFKN